MARYFSVISAPLLIIGFVPALSAAQLDPTIVAQGQVHSGTARGYAERGGYREPRARAVSSRAARTCAYLPNYRARYGARDARVQELTRLCRQVGH